MIGLGIGIILLVFIAGIANAYMDTIKQHWNTSTLPYIKNWWIWVKSCPESWKLKYKHNIQFIGDDPLKRYSIDKLSDKAKFPGSKTGLVFLTNTWHFMQFIMLTSFTISILLGIKLGILLSVIIITWPLWLISLLYLSAFIILKFTFSAGFTLFYHHILIKNMTNLFRKKSTWVTIGAILILIGFGLILLEINIGLILIFIGGMSLIVNQGT